MSNILFDTEQQILDCWGIVDDLKSIYKSLDNSSMPEDKLCNLLIGVSELYHIKFEHLFNTFEELVKEHYGKRASTP